MILPHKPQLQRSTRLGEDLLAGLADMTTHGGIRQPDSAVLVY